MPLWMAPCRHVHGIARTSACCGLGLNQSMHVRPGVTSMRFLLNHVPGLAGQGVHGAAAHDMAPCPLVSSSHEHGLFLACMSPGAATIQPSPHVKLHHALASQNGVMTLQRACPDLGSAARSMPAAATRHCSAPSTAGAALVAPMSQFHACMNACPFIQCQFPGIDCSFQPVSI